jgi:hypothetical protein
MSDWTISRKPGNPGEIAPAAPRFDKNIPNEFASWIIDDVLPTIEVTQPFDIIGALAPVSPGHPAHVLVKTGAGFDNRNVVLHIKPAAASEIWPVLFPLLERVYSLGNVACNPVLFRSGTYGELIDGHAVTATLHIPGRHGPLSENDPLEVGRSLSRLHAVISDADANGDIAERYDALNRTLCTEAEKIRSDNTARSPETWRESLLEAANSFDQIPNAPSPFNRQQVLHGDLSPGNVLFTDDGAVFLDFEDMTITCAPIALDVASVVLRFCRFDTRSRYEIDAAATVEAYLGQADDIDWLPAWMKRIVHRNMLVLSTALRSGVPLDATLTREWDKFTRLHHAIENVQE